MRFIHSSVHFIEKKIKDAKKKEDNINELDMENGSRTNNLNFTDLHNHECISLARGLQHKEMPQFGPWGTDDVHVTL